MSKKRLSKSEHEERLKDICQRVGKGMHYQTIANDLKLDKNQIYKAITDLVKTGRIEKLGSGVYALADGSIPSPPISPSVAEVPPPVPIKDIEELGTTLLGKIGELQPLLLLHKNLFNIIEKITLDLIEAIIDVKPRILTQEEREEYRELKHLKSRAEKIAQARNYRQPNQTRRA